MNFTIQNVSIQWRAFKSITLDLTKYTKIQQLKAQHLTLEMIL